MAQPLSFLADRAAMTVSGTPGTGTATLDAAQTGYQTFAAAGVVNGDSVDYLIVDGNNWEYGQGTYDSSGPTLARTTIYGSSNSNAAISATSDAIIYLTATAQSIQRYEAPWNQPDTADFTTNNFTAQGQNSALNATAIGVEIVGTTQSSDYVFRAGMTVPSAGSHGWKVEARCVLHGNWMDNGVAGIYLRDTGTNHVYIFGPGHVPNTVCIFHYSNDTTYSNTDFQKGFIGNDFWVQIVYNGTDLLFNISQDGISWTTVWSVAYSSSYVSSVGEVGIGFSGASTGADVGILQAMECLHFDAYSY